MEYSGSVFVLESLIKNVDPYITFVLFVLIYLFLFNAYPFPKDKILRSFFKLDKKNKAKSIIMFIVVMAIIFLFYRLFIMTAILDYPMPACIEYLSNKLIIFLESIGVLR